jgi:hypothetical protein
MEAFQRIFPREIFVIVFLLKEDKVFFELKLGGMIMDEYYKRLFEFYKYVGFIKDNNVKIQIFLNGLPYLYSENI